MKKSKYNKLKKILIFILFISITLIFSFGLSKEKILHRYNNIVEIMGKHELTSKHKLKGDKLKGEDDYRGSYVADYDGFTGEEYLFGGTSVEDKEISIKCNIDSENGVIKVILSQDNNKKKVLIEKNGNIDKNINLTPGRNYIFIECKKFYGKINMEIK